MTQRHVIIVCGMASPLQHCVVLLLFTGKQNTHLIYYETRVDNIVEKNSVI